MKVLVSGSTGLIGSALVEELKRSAHEVTRLVRSTPRPGEAALFWDPSQRVLDRQALEGFDAVVHLSGENLIGRWSPQKKARIRSSRVLTTRFLVEALRALERPPRVFACASAVGFYGSRGDQLLNEQSAPGEGFLASVAREWEAASRPLDEAGTRIVNLRFGVVLSARGGALEKMLAPFRLGLGGPLGSGRQYVSWITLEDAARAIVFTLQQEQIQGAVNVCAPQALTNADFAKCLGKLLGRPSSVHVPAFAVRLAAGEMADEMLLASARMEPAKLLAAGFPFRYAEMCPALHALLHPAEHEAARVPA